MATMPTRIDQDLFEAARAAGQVHSRSAAQQLAHWARLGRQMEASPGVTHDEVSRVLAGQASYDDVDGRAQALVRDAWQRDVDRRLADLDFGDRLRAAGRPWAEAEADGSVVIREPDSG